MSLENVPYYPNLGFPYPDNDGDCSNLIGVNEGKSGEIVSCITQKLQLNMYYECEDLVDWFAQEYELVDEQLQLILDNCLAYDGYVLTWKVSDNKDEKNDDLWCVTVGTPALNEEGTNIIVDRGALCLK